MTGERCTVLAEEAMPVEDIDQAAAEGRIAAARDAIGAAESDAARGLAEMELAVAEAMRDAVAA